MLHKAEYNGLVSGSLKGVVDLHPYVHPEEVRQPAFG